MTLSVMITTYNLEKYVEQTINSVLMQELSYDYEILIGDDGSMDSTISIIRQWERKYPERIHVFVMDRDPDKKYNAIERASKNRINLVKHARGKYLIFLDGDDFYTDSKKLQKQIDLLEKKENQDCIACAHQANLYWENGITIPVSKYNHSFKVTGKEYWRYGIYFLSESFMFRNVFHQNFPDVINPRYYDDNIIIFYLLSFGNIIYIPDNMVNYRQTEHSSWNSIDEMERNIINCFDFDIERQINKNFERESRMRHMYNLYFLWRNCKKIPKSLRDKYESQIQKDSLVETDSFFTYSRKSFFEKRYIDCKIAVNLFRFLFVKIIKKIRLRKYI